MNNSAHFCINLARRTDRRAQAEAEFTKHGIIHVEFIDGIDGRELNIAQMKSADDTIVSKGDIGCTLSHLKVLRLAKQRKLAVYTVFEDDVEFADDFMQRLCVATDNLPANADMLYFGGNHDLPVIKVNEHIARMQRTFTTHAMMIRSTVYDDLIKIWERADEKVDIGISALHSKYNCYVITPHIAFQRASYSDILDREQHAMHLAKEGTSNLKYKE